MSSSDGSPRTYVDPKWPNEPFILEFIGPHGDGTVLGPFTAADWYKGDDGTWWGATQPGEKPTALRVRSQEQPDGGPLILHANNGSIGDMDYAVWTRARWATAHPGEDFD